MNYKKILIEYMNAVLEVEGVHFIEYIRNEKLTEEELQVLYRIASMYGASMDGTELSTDEKIKMI